MLTEFLHTMANYIGADCLIEWKFEVAQKENGEFEYIENSKEKLKLRGLVRHIKVYVYDEPKGVFKQVIFDRRSILDIAEAIKKIEEKTEVQHIDNIDWEG